MNCAKWISKRLMHVVALGVVTASALLPVPASHAAIVNWTDATGFWDIAANWSSNPLLPGAADDVVINVGGLQTITHRTGTDTISSIQNANTLIVNGGSTLSISSGGTNTGTMQAGGASAGTLNFNGGTLTNTGGVLNADVGGVIVLNGVTVVGGNLNSTGSGTFVATNNGNNSLSGVTLNGQLDLGTSTGIERVTGGMTLNGTISINNNSTVVFQGNQTVNGTGAIVFGNTGSDNHVSVAGAVTLGSGIVIHGQNGTIGDFGSTLTNNGQISADVSGGTITLARAFGITNSGTLSAQNGGTLVLLSDVNNSGGGHIDAIGAGSQVVQNPVNFTNGVTITGGTINTSGGGVFVPANNGSNFLSGVTLNGTIDLASATGIERVVNGLTLVSGSTINVNNNSVLSFQGDQTLGGSGAIVFGNTGSSNHLDIEGTTNLTAGPNVLIHGQNGTIGSQDFIGGAYNLTNNGTVSADVSGGTITVARGGLITNSGTLSAQNGGTLVLLSNVTNTGGGHIDAIGAGSQVVQNPVNFTNGVTITGGTINTSGGGVFVPANNSGNFLSGVTLNGTIDLASAAGFERVVNGLTMVSGSTININNNSVLAFQGDQTLGGSGAITLGSSGAGNLVTIEGASTLTVGPNVLIRGQNGTIGGQVLIGGANVLANNGTISADVGGGLITIVANAVANAGTLRASNGGTLTITHGFSNSGTVDALSGTINANGGFTGTTGTAQIGPAGQLTIGANSTVGTLTNNGTTPIALSLGTNNITVSTAYNNASFGTGNSFNNHANVSGTGQILAAGDVAQAVTGSNVTNGTTATPTLTIGNVHVGANTFNYQIANTGATGPSLIGAIQTSVNGGNITDARLSGTGVTASNWGPVAPTANTGNLAVAFTAASAGALSPLSGQAVHIVNNFDNLTPQNLSIVLGSGASAFNLAAAAPIGAVNFGTVHVGDAVSQALTIQNTAPAGAFSEKLNASFGGTSDARITTSGAVNLLAAGASNSTSMVVGLNTAAAGTVNGTATVLLQSDGTGTSGLGTTALPSQNVGVSGDIQTIGQVFRLAQPSAHSPEPVALGNVRVGALAQQALTISNLAPNDGFSEKLNASIGGATAGVTATGAFTLLAPGAPGNPAATNSTSLVVGLNTATAGAKLGTATITLASDGTGTSGLGITSLGTQTVNVSGSVFRLANPTLNTPAVTLAARVGDASPTAAVSVTNTSPDAFTEGLKATISAAPPVFTASGSIANLAAGATSASALQVGLQTGTAGTFSGTATVPFTSTGAGTTGAPDVSLGNGTVTLNGKVYTPAQAQVPTPSVDFGIVHKGDVVALRPVEVRNTAPVTALNDVLQGSFTGVSAPFTATGTLGAGIAAGATDTTSLKVGLGTGLAGLFNGSATLGLASHNGDLTDLVLSPVSLTLTGQVNNFAKLDLTKLSGAGSFSKSGSTFLLDFGTLLSGGGVSTALFGLDNAIPSGEPGDLLDVLFGLNAPDFLLTGFGPHNNIAAGQEITGLSIGFDAAMRAQGFDEFITLTGRGHNGSGFSGDLASITLELRASIQQPGGAVPEPATLALVLTGVVFFGAMHMLRRMRARPE